VRRHIKIKGEANPFDPKWETYFENRLGWKMMANYKARTRLINLWWYQEAQVPQLIAQVSDLPDRR
jgi:RNA-directed DNA polymerase